MKLYHKIYRFIKLKTGKTKLGKFIEYLEEIYWVHISKNPMLLQIELTSRCNLRCIMCCRDVIKRNKKIVDFELYKRIIDEAVALHIPIVKPYGLGEPLLYPKTADAIAYAKKKGITSVIIDTNANLLTEKKAIEIIKAGLDKIIISIEGVNKEQYERVRVGGNFNRVLENVKRFKELRDKYNKNLLIAIQTVIDIKGSNNSKKKFTEFWGKYCDKIEFSRLNLHFCPSTKKEKIKYEAKQELMQIECLYPFLGLTILEDGRVTFCCADYNGVLTVGDISKSPLKDIWNSKKMEEIREIFKKKEFKKIPFCHECITKNKEKCLLSSLE